MAFDGFGNFTRLHNWTADKLAAIKITSTRHDEEDDGFSTAFNLVMLRNGVAPMTGSLKLGGNVITGVASGIAGSPGINFSADLTTGFFLPGAALLGVAIGGVEIVRYTGTGQTLTGSLSVSNNIGVTGSIAVGAFAMLGGILEDVNFSATALTGAINVDANNVGVFLYTSNAVGNWTFNFRGDAVTTMNTALLVGQSFTIAIEVPQGAAAFYCTAITVDGVAPSQIKWFGGAPTAGNVTGIDVYTISVIKHGANDFYVRASMSQAK